MTQSIMCLPYQQRGPHPIPRSHVKKKKKTHKKRLLPCLWTSVGNILLSKYLGNTVRNKNHKTREALMWVTQLQMTK